MSNHIVRPDSRGNLRVITYFTNVSASGIQTRQALRATVPFTDAKQAFERCIAECAADAELVRIGVMS